MASLRVIVSASVSRTNLDRRYKLRIHVGGLTFSLLKPCMVTCSADDRAVCGSSQTLSIESVTACLIMLLEIFVRFL